MILTGPAIRDAIRAGTIRIHPLTDEPGDSQVDQAGVTLHLHPRLLVLKPDRVLDVRTPCDDGFDPVGSMPMAEFEELKRSITRKP